MGYGLILVEGKNISLIDFGAVKFSKSDTHHTKLKKIYDAASMLIDKYKPHQVAIEALFYGKNPQSMLKLGRAQGVAISASLNKDIQVFEYAPNRIKQSITGRGMASKEQVAAMLQQMLGFKEIPRHLDATDGLAVAVCHGLQNGYGAYEKGAYKDWVAFVATNPGRTKK